MVCCMSAPKIAMPISSDIARRCIPEFCAASTTYFNVTEVRAAALIPGSCRLKIRTAGTNCAFKPIAFNCGDVGLLGSDVCGVVTRLVR